MALSPPKRPLRLPTSDNTLLRDMQAGRSSALDQLMEKYAGYVYTVIANVITSSGTAADAEELCSDTFLAVWNHAAAISPGKLKPYLAATARNKAKSFLRKKRELPMDLDTLPIAGDNDLEEQTIRRELQAQLYRAIDEMRPQDREIFLRYYYYMQTAQQISQQLDIPHSTVRSRLMRGRKVLKKRLEKEGLL